MGKPAGVELKRWFGYMVALLLFVNIAAVVGSVVIYRSVHSIAAEYQPFMVATTAVEKASLLAQRDMYGYLSEMVESPEPALRHLDELEKAIAGALEVTPSEAQDTELNELKGLVGQYRIAIEQLPDAMSGSRDWSRMDEIRSMAARLGQSVAERASNLAAWSQAEIRDRNSASTAITMTAMYTFIAVMAASLIVLLVLRHWWKLFQDTILGL